ncbi:MAG: AMMECR1 domain-containing protein [Sulfurimonas sp.]|jgi:AMMECR1 domain-containing protein|uniref:AMMECR1 domain-containing protein n=1 Tax=Sulfurimonas sp. TaxID=2022749 RepID=UPI0025D4237C|nr:AMMECR1 domain-containing protein [Sulfurimonas sp.]
MSRSVLLQLARDSIQEVFQAQRTIDKPALLNEHPLLNEKIATRVNIYLNQDLRGSFGSDETTKSLLEDIIYNAKMSAFEDKNFTPLTTSEYLSCEIELLLTTPDGVISEKDPAILED